MRFSGIHKLTSYLMVLSAVVALLLSPELSLLASVLTLVGVALSWFAEPSRIRIERYNLMWNVATVAFIFYLVTDVFLGGSVITSGAHFLLFVLINKLFNRRSSKDYQQAYVVSFLIVVVATTLNTDISYAICFALFILFATWTLTLLHLRREMEENYLLKHADGAQSEKVEVERILNSRRIVGGSFLAGTSLISVGIMVVAALIFVLFPRIGFGLFLGHKRGGVAMVGFSDEVRLGHHGIVRDNPRVVMRVVFPAGRPQQTLRWRGTAFDYYRDGTWSHGPELRGKRRHITRLDGLQLMVDQAPGTPLPLPRPGEPTRRRAEQELTHYLRSSSAVRQEIYLEPLNNTTVIFGADRPLALQLSRPHVGSPYFIPRRGPNDEMRGEKMRTAGVKYVVYSNLESPSAARLRRARPIDPLDPRNVWLSHQLRIPRSLPARVGQLARTITRDKRTAFDKALALQRHLRANYRYTLDLKHDPTFDPVDEFLFETRRGHCEYFASAMALMLRSVGIHARVVNGFAGGDWNELSGYMAVRQGDAHAWVEVYFARIGWVAFDPTPSSAMAAGAPAGWFGSARRRAAHVMDALRHRWFQYVVEYDLGKQVSLFQGVGGLFRGSPDLPSWWRRHWGKLALFGGFALLVIAIVARRRRRRGLGDAPGGEVRSALPPAALLYKQLLALLARAGQTKQPGATPGEFAARLRLEGFGPHDVVQRFTRCYYDARYGGAALDDERRRRLSDLLHDLRRELDAERQRA